jgi:hypothetical protein
MSQGSDYYADPIPDNVHTVRNLYLEDFTYDSYTQLYVCKYISTDCLTKDTYNFIKLWNSSNNLNEVADKLLLSICKVRKIAGKIRKASSGMIYLKKLYKDNV